MRWRSASTPMACSTRMRGQGMLQLPDGGPQLAGLDVRRVPGRPGTLYVAHWWLAPRAGWPGFLVSQVGGSFTAWCGCAPRRIMVAKAIKPLHRPGYERAQAGQHRLVAHADTLPNGRPSPSRYSTKTCRI